MGSTGRRRLTFGFSFLTTSATCEILVIGSQAPQRRRDRLLRERKAKISREFALCPAGLTACRVGLGRNGGYECLDTENELEVSLFLFFSSFLVSSSMMPMLITLSYSHAEAAELRESRLHRSSPSLSSTRADLPFSSLFSSSAEWEPTAPP